jgi:hypothetical protein
VNRLCQFELLSHRGRRGLISCANELSPTTNDAKKDELCRLVDLALFRVDLRSSQARSDEMSFLSYVVHLWFLALTFKEMQATMRRFPARWAVEKIDAGFKVLRQGRSRGRSADVVPRLCGTAARSRLKARIRGWHGQPLLIQCSVTANPNIAIGCPSPT